MTFANLTFDRHIHHPMNFVRYTPWPFFIAWSLFLFFFFLLCYLHYIIWCLPLFIFGFLFLIFFLDLWSNDIFIESSLFGNYSRKTSSGIILGFLVFLGSEAFLFAGFFWAFFDISFNGSITYFKAYSLFNNIGVEGFLNIFVPFYGTILLEMSARFAILAYAYIRYGMLEYAQSFLLFVFFCGIFFLCIQYKEYDTVLFNINDDALASCFFMLTGFHAFHVFVGLLVFYEYYEYNFYSFFVKNTFFFMKELKNYYYSTDSKDIAVSRLNSDNFASKFAKEFFGVYVVHMRYDSLDRTHAEPKSSFFPYKSIGLLDKNHFDIDDIKRREFVKEFSSTTEYDLSLYRKDSHFRTKIHDSINDLLDNHYSRMQKIADFFVRVVHKNKNSPSYTEAFDGGVPTIERSTLYPVALIYWTFVDVVWFFLFCVVYVDAFSYI